MVEPTYHFIKGQGWVVSTAPRILGRTEDKYKLWIVARKPNSGEQFMCRYPGRAFGTIDKPNLDSFAVDIACWPKQDYLTWAEDDEIESDVIYVTFEWID